MDSCFPSSCITRLSWFMDGPLENYTPDLVKASVDVFFLMRHISQLNKHFNVSVPQSSSELDKRGSAALWGLSQLLLGGMLTS